MKKIINKHYGISWPVMGLAIVVLTIASCGNRQEEEPRTQEQILSEVSVVKAVGKVVPEADWAVVSSPTAARISHMEIREGDTVQEGQVLIRLESGTADLDVQQARARLLSLEADRQVTREDLRKAQIYAEELQQLHAVSEKLYAQQAETREKLESDFSNWKQQMQVVAGLEQKLKSQAAAEQEQQVLLRKSEGDLSDFEIRAARAGVITDLQAQLGQSVVASEELARIVDPSRTLVEAEVDELFAGDVTVGQAVTLYTTGRPEVLAQGTIVYASPVLSDKSILYETANEGQDRRVRRIRIQVDGERTLTINAKVDIEIQVQ